MIEERALVLETAAGPSNTAKNIARVKVQRTSSCESCSLKSGCGQSSLTKLSSNHCLELDVENTLDAKSGDQVLIAIPESGLMTASLRIYFVPLIFMILGAVIGDYIDTQSGSLSEIWTMLWALSGLIFGFYLARKFSQKRAFHEDFLPRMTKLFIQSV